MHYNILSYWRHLQNLPEGHEDLPSPRVCRLMLDMFERWQTQQPFPTWNSFGHIRDHLHDDDPPGLLDQPIEVRRGVAIKKTLQQLVSPWAQSHGFATVHPDEIIIGTMPPYSVGQGKEIMGYLKEEADGQDESFEYELGFLNGWSNFGHVVPNHETIIRRGLRAIIQDSLTRRTQSNDPREQAFFDSVCIAMEGVIHFAEGYAKLAEQQAAAHQRILIENPQHPCAVLFGERVAGMTEIAGRLRRIPAAPCESFKDAVQCLLIMNAALHWTGELTSLGRLDQILEPFLEQDKIAGTLSADEAQEVIDCLWVKLDERVMLNRRHFEDRFSSADGALLGGDGPSNFDQGALGNQWMQQVTLGGVKATKSRRPVDASNDITRMCLHAARKFPFNAPTVDLRVHSKTPADLLVLAARAMLSGGAHPILMNDDKIIAQLYEHSGGTVDLESARNYACDGCYETLFPGETEFSFFYVPAVDLLEKSLNSGAGFLGSGAMSLRGTKSSFRTPPADQIHSFADFYAILERHLSLSVNRQYHKVLKAYGSKSSVCASPILSAMIDGCLEAGRDFYNGGARYHMFAPLMTGISTVADSLYVVEELVFQQRICTLPELVSCLRSDWGERKEVIGLTLPAERVSAIQEQCRSQPKFGTGDARVDKYAWKLIQSFVDAIQRARSHPVHQSLLNELRKRFDLPGRPFEILLTPGVGTFEQYVFGGSWAGATPDGRRAGQSIATDLSAAPLPEDLPPILQSQSHPGGWLYARQSNLMSALASWNHRSVNTLSDGAPSDFNIREDFPQAELVRVLRAFAKGKGSNIMTVTVANPETLSAAAEKPDQYNLVRVRMGGWTEFFSVLFPAHKEHHQRRPIYTS